MNLITKTTLFYLLVALLVFGIGGVVAYMLVENEVRKETDFALYDNLSQLTKDVADSIPLDILRRGKVDIAELGPAPRDTFFIFSDTLAPHPHLQGVMEPYRKLTAVRQVGDQYYRFSITDVIIETDDIYEVVVEIMLRLFLILGVAMLFFSFLVTRLLFRPFQKTLEQIRAFRLKESGALQLPDTTTREFRQLNTFLTQMAAKARRDYLAVKEFSENASHEIQTPLAVAQGKLELLLESPGLSGEQLGQVQAIQQSLSKLSRLGKALQLLAKIDNLEFAVQAPIDFSRITEASLSNFAELAALKNLRLSSRIEPNVRLSVDPVLADMLISNLLKNAIRHNEEGGWIEVELNREHFRVRNPGKTPQAPVEQLFERFKKSHASDGSLGLGLAIVKKIADVSQFTVDYEFAEGIHQLTVRFS